MIVTRQTTYTLPPRVRRGLQAAVGFMRRGYRVAGIRRGFYLLHVPHAFPDEREYPLRRDYGPYEAWIRIPHVGLVALPPDVEAGVSWPDAQLAQAEYDVLRQVLTITAENGAQHIFHGRLSGIGRLSRFWTDIFQAVNAVAKEVHCLVDRVTVVNAASPLFDYLGRDEKGLEVANDHARAYVVGAAVDMDDERRCWIVWAAFVGPRIALESLRATLARGNTLRQGYGWSLNWRVRKPVQFSVQPLPDLPGQHLLIITQGAMIQADREAGVGYIVLGEEDESPGPHLIRLLQQATDLPLLPEWGDVLWQAALEGVTVTTPYGARTQPLAKSLDTWGVVRAGWRVDLDPDRWASLVSSLLREGNLRLEVAHAAAG